MTMVLVFPHLCSKNHLIELEKLENVFLLGILLYFGTLAIMVGPFDTKSYLFSPFWVVLPQFG